MVTLGMLDILVIIVVALTLVAIGMYLEALIRGENPIKKLKVNTIYFQDEPGPSYLLLHQSREKAELRLYKIEGANRTKMPKVFAVTDKEGDRYNIVSYEPTIIGGSPDGLPDEIAE